MKQSMSSGVTEAHGSLLYCGCEYAESGDEQTDGQYLQRAFLREGYAGAFTPLSPGNAFHAAYDGPVRLFLKIVVVYFARERKGGTRRFPEAFSL
ncbi:hypothetical protein QUW15_12800 [Desulfovibrio piger]|nr:hypothetical protein [Desulfovibrio piger]